MLIDHFKDVYRHMEWADSMIWQAVLDAEDVRDDEFAQRSLFHIHEVQHSFLNAWSGKPMERFAQDGFGDARAVREWGKAFYGDLDAFLTGLDASQLAESHVLPWAKFFARRLGRDAAETTLIETMHQLGSHSMHHRGQVMRRMRELGVAPPGLDYIVWAWMGRPEPVWDAP